MGSDGNIGYTRDGSFHISGEAGENYLVTAGGEYVLSGNGTKISADDENLQNQIGIFNFGNPYGLSADGDNKFKSTAASGQAYVTVGSIGRGMLETSNVDLTDEMANLMTMQKAYQFNAKMIETADEIENIINNLR
jgi:flagellar basal body rod protein FlgG